MDEESEFGCYEDDAQTWEENQVFLDHEFDEDTISSWDQTEVPDGFYLTCNPTDPYECEPYSCTD